MTTLRIASFLERSRRLRLGHEGRKICFGLILLATILFGQDLVGAATAANRLDPSLRGATGPSNVLVVLDFVPERFHSERLAKLGVFSGRDGSVSRVRLRLVTPENLNRLAALVWVSRIEPLAPPRPPAARPAAPAGG